MIYILRTSKDKEIYCRAFNSIHRGISEFFWFCSSCLLYLPQYTLYFIHSKVYNEYICIFIIASTKLLTLPSIYIQSDPTAYTVTVLREEKFNKMKGWPCEMCRPPLKTQLQALCTVDCPRLSFYSENKTKSHHLVEETFLVA